MELTEDKFKLTLATDLIIFITAVWVNSVGDRADKISMVNELMNKWSERIDTSAKKMKEQIAEQVSESDEETPKDVALILLEVTNTSNKILKGEFKTQMREAIFKGLTAYSQ